MRLLKCLLTKNNCYKANEKFTPKGVMWHSTGANNKKLSRYVQPDDGILGTNAYGNHWNQPKPDGKEVCVHAFIGVDKNGAVATYQTLPWDIAGWHAGGAASDTHLSFEICEDALVDKEYFDAVYKEACELTAYLCKMYNLDPMKDGVVICHSEGHSRGIASNHADVMHWFKRFGKTMDDARKDVKALMKNSDAATKTKDTTDKKTTSNTVYKVQCGSFTKKANAEALVKKLKAAGFDAVIVTEKSTTTGNKTNTTSTTAIKVGDKVRVKKGSKSYDGKSVGSFVYDNIYTADQIKGDRVVVGLTSICTAFNIKDLTKV